MTVARTLYLAAYDVRDPRRLARALKAAKAYAVGGQRSLYECFVSDGEYRALTRDMARLLHRHDRFALIRPAGRPATTLGIAVAPEDPPFFYQG